MSKRTPSPRKADSFPKPSQFRLAPVALAVAGLFASGAALAQQPGAAFQSMVALQAGMVKLPDGTMSRWSGAERPVIGRATDGRDLMTIRQTEQRALLDWEKFELQANEILEFQQQRADWIAVNRVHSNTASRIDGEIRATGRVFILNDNGVLMGEGATVNTRQLVTGRGVSDVLVDGAKTTIVQSRDKAVLNWYGETGMGTQAGEVLRFQQEKNNWIALNRSMLEGKATTLAGAIQADGHVILVSREGLAINGSIEAQQVIASSLDVRDQDFLSANGLKSPYDGGRLAPIFSNSWQRESDTGGLVGYETILRDAPPVSDPSDPLRYAVTVGSSGSIKTNSFGKVMLFGPNVTNKGRISVQDEGQVILAAGDNIWIDNALNWQITGKTHVYTGPFNPYDSGRIGVPFDYPRTWSAPWNNGGVITPEWQQIILRLSGQHYLQFVETVTGAPYTGTLTPAQRQALALAVIGNRNNWNNPGGLIVPYLNRLQAERVAQVGFHARNEGIISALRGGSVDFRGWNLEQMGAVEMTSTALFRSAITFRPMMFDYQEYWNGESDGPWVPGNGNVVFGKGSLTQITPDLEATDSMPVDSGDQSVGTLQINARSVHMQEDALIYLPSGEMNVLLDAGAHVLSNRGAGGNRDNEDGTRFLMERGATIDLSGWETVLGMGYHQVTGKLFAAQLKDSPLQRDGALYRKEISIDRRYGTNVADWESFDNLSKGTLAQFLIDGGTFTMDVGDDFIMKSGSVIDVSGGKITYQDGYVYTTLLRRLDGSIIDIREASPDELYMGLANEWVRYDTKWGRQKTYYIPLMSSVQGKYETSYEHGGKGGTIAILAPDAVLQGTVKGETTVGRYQRNNLPAGGSFVLNNAGESETEYVSNNVLIAAVEQALSDDFGLYDKLSDVYDRFFGEEFDHETDKPASKGQRTDNATLTSADFFNRSTMGRYFLRQDLRSDPETPDHQPLPGFGFVVEAGVNLNLLHGASLDLVAGNRMQFLGSVRTEGGDIDLAGEGLVLGANTALDTRGSWYSEYERDASVPLATAPRIDGGDVSLSSTLVDYDTPAEDIDFILPETARIDTTGGAWVNRDGKLKAGKGGDLSISALMQPHDELVMPGIANARAYGLGGNGRLSLTVLGDIYLGSQLPTSESTEDAQSRQLLLPPSLFENSGFSSIALGGATVTLMDGVHIDATVASLRLKDSSLHNGVPPAYYAPSGTDIYTVAEAAWLPSEQRASDQRDGMDIHLTATGGSGRVRIGEGSRLSTEAGGAIELGAPNIDVLGTVRAPAGRIAINAGIDGTVLIGEAARLLAPGAVRILERGLDRNGREIVGGQVLDGGDISLSGQALTIKEGAVLDVSGTQAVLHLPSRDGNAGVRVPTTVASGGGEISIRGERLDIDHGSYRAHAGGAGARGGAFVLGWSASFGADGQGGGSGPQVVLDNLEQYIAWGWIVDHDWNPIPSLYGTDLSTVAWEYMFGTPIEFPAGFTVGSREELLAAFNAYEIAALGEPPILRIGNNLPPFEGGEPQPLPEIHAGLRQIFEGFGYQLPEVTGGPPRVTHLSVDRIAAGGFSELGIAASPGMLFAGDLVIGGRRDDGSLVFDRIDIAAPRIMGEPGADVRIEAGIVVLSDEAIGGPVNLAQYEAALKERGIAASNPDTRIAIEADILLQASAAHFHGFSDANLISGGDIRLVGVRRLTGPTSRAVGQIVTAGNLSLKADQVYASTASEFTLTAGDTLTVLPQDAGTPINASPYEAGAILNLTAPRIVQGGTLRSPLGTINLVGVDDGSEGANTVTLLPGSLTSVSAEGKTIPYGVTSNGDSWIDPVTGLELTALPTKAINLTADTLDLQEGAVLDVQGGGDLYAWEFTPGVGGSTDWLTGYRDGNYDWVEDPSAVFAVLPDYDAGIAPIGLDPNTEIAFGEKIYLSGGSGLAPGYYTLLPARYALLPGAYRVTVEHHYGSAGMVSGRRRDLLDGSSLQAGYRYIPGQDGTPKYATPGTQAYLVMPGETLRLRSQYVEHGANSFYLSDAFLKKALRTNRPLGEIPRIPLDGGSVVLAAGSTITLDATLKSAAAEGGRGGFADIKGSRIVVAGAGTDTSQYDGYLVLDSERLTGFGAESLLLGGTRRQGQVNLEIDVGAVDIVVDNAGSVLQGPELLFASTGDITIKSGSAVEASGQISGSSGDLRLLPAIGALVDDKGTPYTWDDEPVHGIFDQGTLLRLSSSEQVDILRNVEALDALAALAADPAALGSLNARRVALGQAPIVLDRGNLRIEDGASLVSNRSLAMDATLDTRLAPGATLSTKQISAAASRVSVGDVAAGTPGLVFAGGSLGALAAAEDILLRSYSTVDFFGPATLRADGALTLDSREVRAFDGNGGTVTIAGRSLTLTNVNGGEATATAGNTNLLLEGDNVYFAGQGKWLSGMDQVTIRAKERVIGQDMGTLHVPGDLTLEMADLTAESGAQLFLDAAGAVRIVNNGNAELPAFETLGATLGVTGASVVNEGRIGLTGGTVGLRARSGDVRLAGGSSIDVTSNTSQIFDVEVGVGGGIVNLVADRGDIDMATDASIDVSGTAAGGDAGRLNVSAGLGSIHLNGAVRGDAREGYRSGSFSQLSRTMADFAGLNAKLDAGGFRQARRLEINEGDIDVAGTVEVQEFAVIANAGSINVTGTVRTVGDDGGRIQLSAARDVTLASGGTLLARANTSDGSGGTIMLETVGENGGRINIAAGSEIDVSGTGEGGRTVRLRAPQVGDDLAIGTVAGTITGARSVIAEGFRVYEDVGTIDQGVIDTVSTDATAFMANAAAIRARLGDGVTVAPGIELRSDGDMELVEDWDLHTLRFGDNESAGVLTLRAKGDLLINANLSDGFDSASADAVLLGGDSWTLNLTAGANTTSPDSLAVLPTGLLEAGKGSIIVGGTPDTVEYYRVEITSGPRAGERENRLYRRNADGSFVRNPVFNPYEGFVELPRDAETGFYIDPVTGTLIKPDPVTGDYVDTAAYARRPLPLHFNDAGGYQPVLQYGGRDESGIVQYGKSGAVQWDNSTGYRVRTGTAGINLASGRDVVLQYAPSVIYTAGAPAAPVENFFAPTRLPLRWRRQAASTIWGPMTGYYTERGGDILVRAQGDIVGSASDQLPTAWLWRYGSVENSDLRLFRSTGSEHQFLGRPYEQNTWFVRFDRYQAGIGALGGGNVDISANGNINNLTVNLPNTGRVAGGFNNVEKVLHTTGGGNLTVRAGGNIGTGNFYVADGRADITAGGAFVSSRPVMASRPTAGMPGTQLRAYDLYTMLFTSSGDFRLQSGGDLNIDIVGDPLNMQLSPNNMFGGGGTYGPDNYREYLGDDSADSYFGANFFSYTPDSRVELFSAGGDVKIWNNYQNAEILNWRGGFMMPQLYFNGRGSSMAGPGAMNRAVIPAIWPATLHAIAAAGNVEIKGGMYLAPSPTGNLQLLARHDVLFGQGTRADDPYAGQNADAQNYFPTYAHLYMSQSRPELMPSALNSRQTHGSAVPASVLETAGYGSANSNQAWSVLYPPDLHVGDTTPVRVYAAEGDVVTTAAISVPKAMWVQAGRRLYFPSYTVQHNNPNDLSLVRTGEGLYFSGGGYVRVNGPGRLEIETGRDFWIPSNGNGIVSNRITLGSQVWHPDENAADIAISTGYNQLPDYEAFENAYLNPELAAEIEAYLLADAGDGRELPIYLFDLIYARGNGAPKEQFASPELAGGFVNYIRGLQGLAPLETEADQSDYLQQAWNYWLAMPPSQQRASAYGELIPNLSAAEAQARGARPEFYLPERREGLVNYVRRLQGLEPLKTQAEQLAYVDEAWAYWQTLSTDYKTPMYRNALFMELRTTGREANDADSERNNTTFRGYDAIATLFPGAQKRPGEALEDGESEWAGDFETYASRVISGGGGRIEFVIPGGALRLANVAATPGETGQPWQGNPRGNALRAGIVTQNGGEVNILSRTSVTVNDSRILTTQGGNVMIWSSYGDIAAGKGAQTSISPQFYNYLQSNWMHMERLPVGLPTGAGIGTLATQPGTPPADVDLIAPNGIVDAGDAGLRVSGNFNVFALQILGTDNIDVTGVTTGLPIPPAAPPTSLNVDDAAAKGTRVQDALLDAVKKVQDNASVQGPSLIEVRVLGYGADCATDRDKCGPAQ